MRVTYIYVLSSGSVRFPASGSGDICWPSGESNTIVAGQWHHYVVTWDLTDVRFYFDGEGGTGGNKRPCSKVIDKAYWEGDEDTFIGSMRDSRIALEWDGYIDEVGFWNRTLSTAEVAELYSVGELIPWSSSSKYSSSPSDVAVDDGRFVQVKADFERDSTQDVHLDDFSVGYGAAAGRRYFCSANCANRSD